MTITVGEVLAVATRRLAAAGIDSARLDARVLLGHVLGLEPLGVVAWPQRPLAPEQAAGVEALVARRERREPLAHLTGRREFWSLPLRVSPATLDPRADTEAVVEAALAAVADRAAPLRLLDLGTGSGCILLALLTELPGARGVGVDASAAALAVAAENAASLGLAHRVGFVSGDWGKALAGRFDVIVGNPPYIRDEDIAGLAPEVAAFEPRRALSGGPDGLDCYRTLASDLCGLLAPSGVVVLEVGRGQADAVADILTACGLASSGRWRDLAGVERCVMARRCS